MVLDALVLIIQRQFIPGINLVIIPVRILALSQDSSGIQHDRDLPDEQIAVWVLVYGVDCPLIGLLIAFLGKHFFHFPDQFFNLSICKIFPKSQQRIQGNMKQPCNGRQQINVRLRIAGIT